jgi:hypothetical protein
MKEELQGPKVTKAAVAIVKELNEAGEEIFNVYLLNYYEEKMEGVLVTSTGYAVHHETQEQVKTSTLRHLLDEIPSNSFKRIEPIIEDVFGLNNEFWVSFWINNVMYDKKFIFLQETIKKENFVQIPLIEKMGVMIRC